MALYIKYPLGTMVEIIAGTHKGKKGEAFERLDGMVSVFIDREQFCKYFRIENVLFI